MASSNPTLLAAVTRSLSLLALAAVGCSSDPPAGPTPSAPPSSLPRPPASTSAAAPVLAREVRVLVSADENGFLSRAEGATKGGAAEMLAQWIAVEHHCPGPLGKEGVPSCEHPETLALSTGDHFTGPAISSASEGLSVAEVMRRMGYAASGFGNHELDFGEGAFKKAEEAGGFRYLAANVTVGGERKLELAPFAVFERNGLKIGVVALSDVKAPSTTMPSRLDGITFEAYDAALKRTLPEVAKAGADATIVLIDDCPERLEPVIAQLGAAAPAAVVGGHSAVPYQSTAGKTPLLFAGKHFESYARVTLSFNAGAPAGKRLLEAKAERIDVTEPKEDADAKAIIDRYRKEVDAVLGEEVGFSAGEIAAEDPLLATLTTRALRETLQADVSLINKRGIRHGLPKGKITKGAIYGVVPFENSVMLVSVSGAELAKLAANENALVGGLTKKGDEWIGPDGKPLEPERKYKLATLDYLYFGRDGFELEKLDPEAFESGMMVQTVLAHFTKELGSGEKKPLEKLLAAKPGKK